MKPNMVYRAYSAHKDSHTYHPPESEVRLAGLASLVDVGVWSLPKPEETGDPPPMLPSRGELRGTR